MDDKTTVTHEQAKSALVTSVKIETKFTKKIVVLSIIVVIAIVIAIAIAFSSFHESKLEKVADECLQIAGTLEMEKDYFTIDTYPDYLESLDAIEAAVLAPKHQADALEAIKYANEELGFNSFLFDKMLETTALMGRQSEENDKYIVSWTYHPDDGLEVTYEKK